MNEQITESYNKLGINISDYIKKEFKRYKEIEDKTVKKCIEFFLLEFVLSMRFFQVYDKQSFDYYKKTIVTNSNINFWGEYFEIITHFRFLEKAKKIGLNLRRGNISNNESDLVIFNENESFQIELTTLKYNDSSIKTNSDKKIIKRIKEKNEKPYANENCALIINVSNLYFLNKIGITNLNNSFLEILEKLKSEIKYNRILLIRRYFIETGNNLHYDFKASEYKYFDNNDLMNKFFQKNDNNYSSENATIFFRDY